MPNLESFRAEDALLKERAAKARAALEAAMQSEAEKPITPDARRKMLREADEAEQRRHPSEPELIDIRDLPKSAPSPEAKAQSQEQPRSGKSVEVMTAEQEKK